MRPNHLLLPLLAIGLSSCEKKAPPVAAKPAQPIEIVTTSETRPAPVNLVDSVVRINSTLQDWSAGQPWEKEDPYTRRGLAAIVGDQKVLTTAEMVADATYLEFESPDGTRFAEAKVIAVDYEANLALLGPASEEEGKKLFLNTKPLEIAKPSTLGDTMEVLQVEDNGVALLTPGLLQSIDVTSNFLPNQSFLTYRVKASMQTAASSYSLPVLQDGKVAGVLFTYDSDDQICDVSSTDIVTRFLKEAATGSYKGFPSLGVSVAKTEDTSFREWLKIPDDKGGLYINTVRKGGAADAAGVKKGDVLLAIDGQEINRRGYYEHPNYGSLFWGHLVRGENSVGQEISLSLLRDGEPLELKATLTRDEEENRLVPNYSFGKAPNYLVKGGFVFQELSRSLLEAFGKDWTARAPLNLLDAFENPEKYEGKVDRVVFLSGAIATPATVGYERLRNLIVRRVNGKEVRDMKSLKEAFDSNTGDLHSIEFDDENFTVYLDGTVSDFVDKQLLQRGITQLSRTE
ncbi:PDZ domain-containing protein [Luteolibacter pohnpeiensis]|uniref:PDZ domain-containing protein n=1 Tax=Luteolibacter pohnpeiensis TaxID=454153 RepID=A0A934VPA1_9BACT|nr:S1C family serine protease [Luteolibacter pohnpeiensis]MBK1880776.1 PDZ domain-containing protein [Luteolibacter pohnpeiensis]